MPHIISSSCRPMSLASGQFVSSSLHSRFGEGRWITRRRTSKLRSLPRSFALPSQHPESSGLLFGSSCRSYNLNCLHNGAVHPSQTRTPGIRVQTFHDVQRCIRGVNDGKDASMTPRTSTERRKSPSRLTSKHSTPRWKPNARKSNVTN